MGRVSYKELVACIDSVAQRVEDLGLIKEASYLDVIANTLEREAGLGDILKRGLNTFNSMYSKIPADIKGQLQGKSLPDIIKSLTKIVTGGKEFLNKELFDRLMSAAGLDHGVSNNFEKDAGVVSKSIAIILLTIVASAAGKDVSKMTFSDYQRVQDTISAEDSQNRGGVVDREVIMSKGVTSPGDMLKVQDSIINREVSNIMDVLKKNGAKLTYTDPSTSQGGVGGLTIHIGMPEDIKQYLIKENSSSSAEKGALINMTAEALFKIFTEDKGSVKSLALANVAPGSYYGILKNTIKNFYSF